MKKIILAITVTFVGLNLKAQNVTIPDVKFRNALIAKGVDTNNDSIIQKSEAEAVKKLIIYKKSITDLTGIEAFTKLTYLACDTNSLTSLDLHANVLLDTLLCNGSKIASLDISMLPNLTKLNCSSNKITTFNCSSNTALKWFDIGGNTGLVSIDLTQNVNLEYLDVVYCTVISNLDLSKNLKLKTLYVIQTTKLLTLDLSYNTALTTFNSYPNFLAKPGMTIYVNATQNAAIPAGWSKNASDKYVLKSSVGIDELSTPATTKKVVRVFNLEGQEVNMNDANQGIFIYEYNDGSVQKVAKFN
jgi:hypothetical protein